MQASASITLQRFPSCGRRFVYSLTGPRERPGFFFGEHAACLTQTLYPLWYTCGILNEMRFSQ